jgi:hypothetical protein
MFSLAQLLERAHLIEPISEGGHQAFIDATMQQLRGHVIKVPGHSSQRFPQAPKLLDPIRDVLETSSPFLHDEIRIPAVRELLFRPQRVYPARESAGGATSVTLLGAFHDPAREDPVAIELQVLFEEVFSIDALYFSADEAADELARIYTRTELSARTVLPGPKKAPRLVWIGGSAHEGGAPADWRERIEASAAVRGLSARIFEEPYRRFDSMRREVHDTAAVAAVVWVPYAGDPSGWSAIPAVTGGDLKPIETSEAAFEDALLDSIMQLDECLSADRERVDEASRATPEPKEVRIYKKEYATPGHDVMVQSNDCGHNAWEPARKAPKAEKGIAKLEPNAHVASLEKCMRCTGGGRWRVTFT